MADIGYLTNDQLMADAPDMRAQGVQGLFSALGEFARSEAEEKKKERNETFGLYKEAFKTKLEQGSPKALAEIEKIKAQQDLYGAQKEYWAGKNSPEERAAKIEEQKLKNESAKYGVDKAQQEVEKGKYDVKKAEWAAKNEEYKRKDDALKQRNEQEKLRIDAEYKDGLIDVAERNIRQKTLNRFYYKERDRLNRESNEKVKGIEALGRQATAKQNIDAAANRQKSSNQAAMDRAKFTAETQGKWRAEDRPLKDEELKNKKEITGINKEKLKIEREKLAKLNDDAQLKIFDKSVNAWSDMENGDLPKILEAFGAKKEIVESVRGAIPKKKDEKEKNLSDKDEGILKQTLFNVDEFERARSLAKQLTAAYGGSAPMIPILGKWSPTQGASSSAGIMARKALGMFGDFEQDSLEFRQLMSRLAYEQAKRMDPGGRLAKDDVDNAIKTLISEDVIRSLDTTKIDTMINNLVSGDKRIASILINIAQSKGQKVPQQYIDYLQSDNSSKKKGIDMVEQDSKSIQKKSTQTEDKAAKIQRILEKVKQKRLEKQKRGQQ